MSEGLKPCPVQWALDELDGSDFSAIREHSSTLRSRIADLEEELEQQADGTSTIISLLQGQSGPVAASLRGMLSIQEQAARAAICVRTEKPDNLTN